MRRLIQTAAAALAAVALGAWAASHSDAPLIKQDPQANITEVQAFKGEPIGSGPFVQVNRMGDPLSDEVLVALNEQDNPVSVTPSASEAEAA